MISISDIEAARERFRGAVCLSPCAYSETVSKMTGNKVYLKLENLQMTGSFKERGAANKLGSLTPEERARGVICASAGNHAQGVAYHAQRAGLSATIVMPITTPIVKTVSTRSYGANVVLFGSSYDEAFEEARRIEREENRVFVHAFDDPLIIAGQGTLGLELLEQNPYLDAVVVPIGGGGLIAGVALALKETNPKIRVIGVESAVFPSMQMALKQGEPVMLPPGRTIAEGIAVRRVGAETLPIVARYVDEIVTVDDEEIAKAILLLLEREKTVAEGAGAAPLAALVQGKIALKGKKIAVVVGGGNIDVTLLATIIERGLVKDGRMVRMQVRVPDHPGSLHRLTGLIAETRANVLSIEHNRVFAKVALGETEVECTLETRGRDHIEEITKALGGAGYEFDLLTP